MTEGAAAQTVVEVLRSDHEAITGQLADPLVTADGEDGDTARVGLVMDLVRHFVAEEQHLYPTLRARVEAGEALAGEEFAASRACESELRRLEGRDIGTEELVATIAAVRRRFAEHVAHQEESVFSRVEDVCTRVELIELGSAALGAEQLAPTRPRRLASEHPGLNRMAGVVEGFVDRLRDLYTGRGVRDGDGTGTE